MLSYPPRELWPDKIYELPELAYPSTLNACYELIDANLARGRGSAPAIYSADSVVTYDETWRARIGRCQAEMRTQGAEMRSSRGI